MALARAIRVTKRCVDLFNHVRITFETKSVDSIQRKDREAIAFFKDEIKDCQRYVKTASIIIGYFEGTNNSLEVSPELNSYAVWALCVMRLHLWKLHDEKKLALANQ